MANENFSSIPPFVTVNATTASPSFVNPAITTSITYEAKTVWVVLSVHEGRELANVFRRSHFVPDTLSRDVYEWKNDEWLRLGKDPQKYPVAPDPPTGAQANSIEGVAVWTMQAMTSKEMQRFRKLTRRLSV